MERESMDTVGREGVRRRTVLKVAAAGSAAAVVGRAMQLDAYAYNLALEEGLVVLNPMQAETVQAIAARIWPGDADDPGAREAGAVYYIDRALAGPYADHLVTYVTALEQIDAAANSAHGSDFAYLDEAQQDAMLTSLSRGELRGVSAGQAFFNLVRTHTMEGVFSDPIYGGNRDFVGWKAVGYPGPFYFISIEEQQSFEPLNMPYQSIVDL